MPGLLNFPPSLCTDRVSVAAPAFPAHSCPVPLVCCQPAWAPGMPLSIPFVPLKGLLFLPGSAQTPLRSLLKISPLSSCALPCSWNEFTFLALSTALAPGACISGSCAL